MRTGVGCSRGTHRRSRIRWHKSQRYMSDSCDQRAAIGQQEKIRTLGKQRDAAPESHFAARRLRTRQDAAVEILRCAQDDRAFVWCARAEASRGHLRLRSGNQRSDIRDQKELPRGGAHPLRNACNGQAHAPFGNQRSEIRYRKELRRACVPGKTQGLRSFAALRMTEFCFGGTGGD